MNNAEGRVPKKGGGQFFPRKKHHTWGAGEAEGKMVKDHTFPLSSLSWYIGTTQSGRLRYRILMNNVELRHLFWQKSFRQYEYKKCKIIYIKKHKKSNYIDLLEYRGKGKGLVCCIQAREVLDWGNRKCRIEVCSRPKVFRHRHCLERPALS